jgi:hypothetical protein
MAKRASPSVDIVPDPKSIQIVSAVCRLAGPLSIFDDLRKALGRHGVIGAVRSHRSDKIFDWLMTEFSQQGISDRAAQGYIAKHGNLTFAAIEAALAANADCPKLAGHWTFHRCSYRKSTQTCNEPSHFPACSLPTADLRNGRLNQLGYSLYFFIRDVADGDLVAWIDAQLKASAPAQHTETGPLTRLIEPMQSIFGVSDKVLSMALSALMLGTGHQKPRWMQAGIDFVVVDRLVHNFLARTGILARASADHPYGPRCYGPNGCAAQIRAIAKAIDAHAFNAGFPRDFPRFVQLAIWCFCAEGVLNICNGRRIPRRQSCRNEYCSLYHVCERRPLVQK